MSNKIVPSTYRSIIDDVIGSMRAEFDDYGVSEEVLSLLQDKWETKVIASKVADFEPTGPPGPLPSAQYHPSPSPIQQHSQQHQHHTPASQPYQLPPPPQQYVKTEPIDRPYVSLNPSVPIQQYVLPSVNGHPRPHPGQLPGHQSVLVLPRGAPPAGAKPPSPNTSQARGGGSGGRIPQLDGPSSIAVKNAPSTSQIPQLDGPGSSPSSSGSVSPEPSPAKPKTEQAFGNEEINSDLDDSESELDDDEDPTAAGGADMDIVFCTYDKVARVKNKWKCVLKDGMIHVNGKDYLFAKCSGEFEW